VFSRSAVSTTDASITSEVVERIEDLRGLIASKLLDHRLADEGAK
jgi:hypothetical protein